MKACGSAGRQCPFNAVVTVRIFGVGDRHLCQSCFETYTGLGMDMRVLDPNAPLPEWRTRSLLRDNGTPEPAL